MHPDVAAIVAAADRFVARANRVADQLAADTQRCAEIQAQRAAITAALKACGAAWRDFSEAVS